MSPTTHSLAALDVERAGDRVRRGRSRRPVRLALGMSTGLALVLGAGAAAPAAASTAAASTAISRAVTSATTIGVPTTPANLPEDIEDLPAYVKQVSCDPTAKQGTLALGRLLTTTYPGTGYLVGHDCGNDTIASEHVDGRGLDWVVSARSATQKAKAQAFLDWLFAPDSSGRAYAIARRLGVMYVIWDDRIWGDWNPLDGWSPYSTCAAHPETTADTVCHRDRMHFSLSWAGALAETSFWSGSVAATDYGPCRAKDLNWAPRYTAPNAKPCTKYPVVTAPAGASAVLTGLIRYSGAEVGPGDTGPVVSAVQRALGVTADGAYGPYTADAVVAFQTQHRLAPSGAMDEPTWRALLAVQNVKIVTEQIPAPTSALTKYASTVLRYGSHGAAVTALQKRLKVTPANGTFGPKTRAAVVAFQMAVKLTPTGIVDALTWRALGA